MPPRRRTDPQQGRAALSTWLAGPQQCPAPVLATAVRFTLEEFAARFPGRSTEIRVPPIAAVQCVAGVRHTRGTPPNVVETDAHTWLALATGSRTWADAVRSADVVASGSRSDLSGMLPLLAP